MKDDELIKSLTGESEDREIPDDNETIGFAEDETETETPAKTKDTSDDDFLIESLVGKDEKEEETEDADRAQQEAAQEPEDAAIAAYKKLTGKEDQLTGDDWAGMDEAGKAQYYDQSQKNEKAHKEEMENLRLENLRLQDETQLPRVPTQDELARFYNNLTQKHIEDGESEESAKALAGQQVERYAYSKQKERAEAEKTVQANREAREQEIEQHYKRIMELANGNKEKANYIFDAIHDPKSAFFGKSPEEVKGKIFEKYTDDLVQEVYRDKDAFLRLFRTISDEIKAQPKGKAPVRKSGGTLEGKVNDRPEFDVSSRFGIKRMSEWIAENT